MKKRLFVDMDNTITDISDGATKWFNEKLKERQFNNKYPTTLNSNDIVKYKFWENYGLDENIGKKLTDEMFNTEHFWYDLEPIRDSINVLRELSNVYDIYIATRPIINDICIPEKIEWLKVHLPFIPLENVIFVFNKGILNGDFLIDDEINQLLNFSGRRILFCQPYNRENLTFTHNLFFITNSWIDIKNVLMEAANGVI